MLDVNLQIGDVLPFSPAVYHETYAGLLETWESCRDAYAGSIAIKSAGEKYLPRLSGQKAHEKLGITQEDADEAYKDYKNRATWYGATKTTINAYRGMITRKPPVFSYEPAAKEAQLKNLMDHVTIDGLDANAFISSLLQEILIVNKVGVLEDFPEMLALDDNGNLIQRVNTQLEYEKEGIRSYSSIYRAESIINWTFEDRNGSRVPVGYVLTEWKETYDETNPFIVKYVPFYRILELVDVNGSDVYRQVVLRPKKGETKPVSGTPAAEGGIPAFSGMYSNTYPGEKSSTKYVVDEIVYPMKDGEYMNRIPFTVLTNMGKDMLPRTPLMLDLVEMNLGHYRNSADQEHELHVVSVKTAIYPGWDIEIYGQPVQGQATTCPPDQRPYIMEASNSSSVGQAMKDKETLMAVLGAQMLGNQGRYVQSAETATINNSGESSILSQLAVSLSKELSELFTFKAKWSLADDNVSIKVTLNTDFVNNAISGQELTAWMQSLQSGAISPETYFYNLSKREVYKNGWTFDDEMNALDEAGLNTSNASAVISELQSRLDALEKNQNVPQEPPVGNV